MSKSDDAVKCFAEGFNCSQAVFTSFCEDLGLDKKTALKIASGFGGGMAHLDETCGAVTGAFMALGLKHGRFIANDIDAKAKTNGLVQEFTKRFKEMHGSIRCTGLLNCDLSTPEGVKSANDQNVFKTKCPNFVRDAAKIVEELIAE